MRKFVFIASLAAMIVMAVPAMASAVTLTAGGATLEEGDPITATSSNLLFTGSSGLTLNCAVNHVAGTYDGSSTIDIEIGTFTGAGGGACATNNPSVTIDYTAINLPWTLHLNENDVAVITGVAFTTTVTVGGTSVNHCTFTANNGVVSGTYNTTETLSITIPNAAGGAPNFTGSPAASCPTSELHGSFDTVSSEGEHIEAH